MIIRYLHCALACVALAAPLSGCTSLGSAVSSVSSVSSALTQGEISSGLKEALNLGITAGINKLSATGGYYNDLAVKIGLPSEASTVITNVSKLPGGQALVTKVVKNINYAASDAAGQAIPIFTNALTSMTIDDAKTILTSKTKTAATEYFKSSTKTPLKKLFSSYIDSSIEKKLVGDVSAKSSWDTMTSQWNQVASTAVGKIAGLKTVNTDLGDYLTDKAVDGIYVKVGEKEKEIRTNVSARSSALLKKVFAHQ